MTLDASVITTQPCPQCKAPMPVTRGFVTWCDACNWNIRPQEKERRYSILEKIWLRLGKQAGRALVEELKRKPPEKPQLHLSTILAGVIALAVHSLTLLCLGMGIWLLMIFFQWTNWFALLGALCLLGMVWLIRPRVSKVPPLLPRADFPSLYALADSIADAMNSPRVAGISINPDYNAFFGRFGWQQKSVLGLGLPLLLASKGQEKVALMAHEIAHGVSNDPMRMGWLQVAIFTLQEWVYVLRPHTRVNVGRGTTTGAIVDIASLLTNAIGFVVEKIVYAILYVLALLTFRDSQRAEYRADYLSAQVSGTNGALRALDNIYLASNFYSLLQKATLKDPNTDLFTEFDRYRAALPAREKERLHRGNLLEGSRLDSTHPPTSERIEMLQAHPVHVPKVTIERTTEAQIEQELAKLRQPVQRELLERWRRGMYY